MKKCKYECEGKTNTICSKPYISHGAVLSTDKNFQVNDEVRVKCNQGWHLVGGADLVCGADGTFSNLPRCEKIKTCSRPQVDNGGVEPMLRDITPGLSYRVTCDETFTFSGSSSTLTCQADRKFDHETPTCSKELPSWPDDFTWSYNGVPEGFNCVKINKDRDVVWGDNFFCWKNNRLDPGLRWSTNGPVEGQVCTKINEPWDLDWNNNYLCLPAFNSYIEFHWSSAGSVDGKDCIQWYEPGDWGTWHDNYLCANSVNGPTVSAPLPTWPDDFLFSNSGVPEGYSCIKIWEQNQEDSTWDDNFFCWKDDKRDPGFRWSQNGPIPDNNCVMIEEPGEAVGDWEDNYLCWPTSSPYQLQWSYNGQVESEKCILWNEPEDNNGWDNNFLCSVNNFLSEESICSCKAELDDEKWEAVDVDFDLDEVEESLSQKEISHQTVNNKDGTSPQSSTFSVSKTVSETITFSQTTGVSISAELQFETNLPSINPLTLTTTVGVGVSTSFTVGVTRTEEVEKSSVFTCTAPAEKSVTCTAYLQTLSLEVPYTIMWRNKVYGCTCETEGVYQAMTATGMIMNVGETDQ